VKQKLLIVMTAIATAFASQSQEVQANSKKEGQFSSLSQQMIQNRKDRVEIVNRSVACLNAAKDSKMLDACVQDEIQSIRQLIDGFCQADSEANKNSPDFRFFCANRGK